MDEEHERLENAVRAVLKASPEDSDVSQKELAGRLRLTRNAIATWDRS